MNEMMYLSLRTRMNAARLARLFRKYDRLRTDLSDEAAILDLLRRASQDGRDDIGARYQELLAALEPSEMAWLRAQGLGCPESSTDVGNVPPTDESPQAPLMMYRGQVVRG